MGLKKKKKGLLFIQLRAACNPLMNQGTIYLTAARLGLGSTYYMNVGSRCERFHKTTSHLLSSDSPKIVWSKMWSLERITSFDVVVFSILPLLPLLTVAFPEYNPLQA